MHHQTAIAFLFDVVIGGVMRDVADPKGGVVCRLPGRSEPAGTFQAVSCSIVKMSLHANNGDLRRLGVGDAPRVHSGISCLPARSLLWQPRWPGLDAQYLDAEYPSLLTFARRSFQICWHGGAQDVGCRSHVAADQLIEVPLWS